MSKIDKTFKKGEQLRASDLNLIVDAINDSAIQSGTGENSMVQNGGYCDASGDYSSAFGWGTKAGSNNAHAEGDGTEANEYASHAEGSHTIANNRNEHAEGTYNVSHTNTIHSTGIGNKNERKNAFEIMQDGSAYLYGVGGYVGTDIKDATHPNIKTLQEVIAEGGGDGGKVFVATYNETTYDEVSVALAEDKTVIVNYNNRTFTFLQEDSGVYSFVAIGGSEISNFTIEMIVLFPDNEWNHYEGSDIASVANLEDGLDTKLDKPSATGAAGQVLTSDGNGGQTWQNIADKMLVAEYGDITFDAIRSAYNSGKIVVIKRSQWGDDFMAFLNVSTNQWADFIAFLGDAGQGAYLKIHVTSANVWSAQQVNLEKTSNKVTSLTSSSTDTQYPSAKCVYDNLAEKSDVVNEITTVPSSGGFLPNKFYKLGTLTGTYTFDLSPEIGDVYNEYMIDFVAGSPAPSVTWPQSVAWFGGSAPTITAGKHYQISIVNSLGVSAEF